VKKFTVHQAKTHLSKLLRVVQDGEEVFIANRNQLVVKSSLAYSSKRKLGTFAGTGASLSSDFDDELDMFEQYVCKKGSFKK